MNIKNKESIETDPIDLTPLICNGNPYENLQSALNSMGFKASGAINYNKMFGISLQKRAVLPIENTSHLISNSNIEVTTAELPSYNSKSTQVFTGDELMAWIADFTALPEQPTASIVTAANTYQAKQASNTAGVCHALSRNLEKDKATSSKEQLMSMLTPVSDAGYYMAEFKKAKGLVFGKNATVVVVQPPKHGKIANIKNVLNIKDTEVDYIMYPWARDTGESPDTYVPNKGYSGKDFAVLRVKDNNTSVDIYYFFVVSDEGEANIQSYCPAPYRRGEGIWKISSTTPEGTPVLSSEYSELASTGDYALSTADFAGYDYLPPTITFRDLTGSAVGETVGKGANATITLDTDAAGHGWYIGGLTTEDRGQNLSTPSSIFNPLSSVFRPPSSDWLPTSNPNEWVARAGTAAAGKMDMLTVLLHEYGHALGIEHSADSHDYMATTLTPGMRRLPNSDEMQLMAQLAAEARETIMAGQGYTLTVANNNTDSPTPTPTLPISMGFGISFLGLLRRNSSTSSIFANAAPAQYDIAANTTLTNGNFAGNNTNAWETTGKVNANNGAAVLSEVSNSQTRLNQVFVVGADDRYLSFTLSNIGLEDALNSPDDAFEVALLNANTGASLTPPIGLTRTDALLNIQANGNELKATGVTSVINADGSRTYVVDLLGIAVGTAVNLSFDLIGFGNTVANTGLPHSSAGTNSHVTARDVRLTGAVITPQANDDMAMGAEDTVMQIIALANDLNIVQANTSFSPIIVAAPTHGTVSINTDGSFSYTPHANYFGVDSFTYKVSNGLVGNALVESSLATVNLTVTAVNDAPTAGNLSVTTAEDTAITLNPI